MILEFICLNCEVIHVGAQSEPCIYCLESMEVLTSELLEIITEFPSPESLDFGHKPSVSKCCSCTAFAIGDKPLTCSCNATVKVLQPRASTN